MGHNRVIFYLVARGAIIMLFAMAVSVAIVAWTSSDLPPDIYRRCIRAALFIPVLIAPPISLLVGWQNYRNYLLHCRVEWLAEHDEMTGILNWRAFRSRAEKLLGERDETGMAQPALLILADIDRFKRVNDSLGHDAGDQAIRHVAQLLTKLSPEGSVLARLGGEEFAILTKWTSLADARGLAELIRSAVEQSPCVYQGENISLTLSLGIAIGSRSERINAILQRADKQLYFAKENGRNTFSIASVLAA